MKKSANEKVFNMNLGHSPDWEQVRIEKGLTDEGLEGFKWLHAIEMVQGYITDKDVADCPY